MNRTIALLCALLLLASACGDAAEVPNEAAASTANDEVSEPTTAASASASEPQTIEEYLGTATAFLRQGAGGGGGRGGGLADLDSETVTEEQRLIEIEVQRCMQAQGFEYVPEDVGDGLRFFLATEGQGVSAQDYAETKGFGISTRFDEVLEGEVDLGTDEESANDVHLASLSEGEADAWLIALRGEAPVRDDQGRVIDPETGDPLPPGQRGGAGGCRNEAQIEVRGDLSELGELADDYAALEERIDADPRITELGREWADCMAEGGFTYRTEAEARGDIQSQFQPLFRSFIQAGGLGGGAGGGGRLGAIEALADIGLTDEQELELQQLQDLEREIAIASLACSGDSDQEIAEIRAGYEAEFIEANRGALEAFAG